MIITTFIYLYQMIKNNCDIQICYYLLFLQYFFSFFSGTSLNTGLDFLAVAVVRKENSNINFNNLKGKKSCHPSVGHAAGWTYPVAQMIETGNMDITECNVAVKSAAAFFGDMCAPNGLARFYNPFGKLINT